MHNIKAFRTYTLTRYYFISHRLLSPTINGSIYSWGLTNVKNSANGESALGFPFNQYFPFLVLSAFAVASFIFESFFPRSLNERYQLSEDLNSTHSTTNGDCSMRSNEMEEDEIIDNGILGEKRITNFSMRYSRIV